MGASKRCLPKRSEKGVHKLPYMPFYTKDWLSDPALSICHPATRGVWMDLLSVMHELGRVGELTGTLQQLASWGRCSPAQFAQALTDLKTSKAADVTERNGTVTVVNRRMRREYKEREASRLRVGRHRRNASVTPPVTCGFGEIVWRGRCVDRQLARKGA